MQIIRENKIRLIYKGGFSKTANQIFDNGFKCDDSEVEYFVIHGTETPDPENKGDIENVLRWVINADHNDPARAALYKKGVGLPQDWLGKKGQIYEIIDGWSFHSSIGINDRKTYGVEAYNNKPLNAGEYTDAQYQALADRYTQLRRERFKSMIHIAGHGRMKQIFNGGWKECPGNFHWHKLLAHLSENWIFDFDIRRQELRNVQPKFS